MAGTKKASAPPTDVHRSIPVQYVIIAILVILIPLAYYFGYSSGYSAGANAVQAKYAPSVSNATSAPISGASADSNVSKQLVDRCISSCKNMKSVGVNFASGGGCIYPTPSVLNGYVCAVVVKDMGHCDAYYKGAPEIVLDPACEYKGVYHYKSSKAGGTQ